MPEITWRNITTVGDGGNTANRSTANGVDTIMKAFDPLRQELENYTTRDEQNWNATAAANTRAMKAELQNIQSLKDLNSRDDQGHINEAAFNARFGAQYDPSALPGAVSEARQRLQNIAANEALPVALNAADKERDLTAGLSSLEQQYRSAGMRENEIQKRLNSFMVDNQGRTALYAKANKDEVEAFRSKVASPTSPEQVEALVAQGGKAGVKDLDLLRSTLKGELDDHYIEGKYNISLANLKISQNQDARASEAHARSMHIMKKQEAEEDAYNRAGSKYTALRAQGASHGEALQRSMAGLNGANQLRMLAYGKQYEDNTGLTPDQQKEVTRGLERSALQLDELSQKNAELDQSFINQRDAITDVTAGVLKHSKSLADKYGGISGAIVQEMGSKGLWSIANAGDSVSMDKKDAADHITYLREAIQKASDEGGWNLTPDEIDGNVWVAYQRSAKYSRFNSDKPGYNKQSMEDQLVDQLNRLSQAHEVEKKRLEVKAAADQELKQKTLDAKEFSYGQEFSLLQQNRSGVAGNPVEGIQNIEKNTFDLSNYEGVADQYRKASKVKASANIEQSTSDKEKSLVKKAQELSAKSEAAVSTFGAKALNEVLSSRSSKGKKDVTPEEVKHILSGFIDSYKDEVFQGKVRTVSPPSILENLSSRNQPDDATYNKAGENNITSYLRQKGVEAQSLLKRRQLEAGLEAAYPNMSKTEILLMLKKAFKEK